MTTLAARRIVKPVRATSLELPGTASTTYYEGGLACWDTSTGKVVKGQASTTLVPIGHFAETKTLGSSGGNLVINLLREFVGRWYVNSTSTDEVTAVGIPVYIVDDQTVADNDGSSSRSKLGTAWKLDTAKGVLVGELFA